MGRLQLLLLLFMLCCMQPLYAQREGYIWYFGNYAGLDFNSGSPKALNDGRLSTFEGCATISTKTGKLLFYTDGIYVWNNKHALMPDGDGLKGDPSSTQSAIIVPFPGDTSKYYIFTVDNQAGDDGFQYSVVDLTKDGGKGDITIKNRQLLPKVCEKLTAVRHANNTDNWVIVHLWESRKFAAYLVNEKGIQNPVYSEVGVYHGDNVNNTLGCLKASPDGSRLASARYNSTNGECQVFDFDNKTGKITNPILIPGLTYAYGVEFSPNSKVLYVGCHSQGDIFQYKLDVADTAKIKYTSYCVSSGLNGTGTLQLGPDNKIYVAQYGAIGLHIIEEPDKTGHDCSFKQNGLLLGGSSSTNGLPAFNQSYFRITGSINFTGQCFGAETRFTGQSKTNPDKWEWNFGDPASGASNVSTLQNPVHTFTAPGVYNVTLAITILGITETVSKEITISLRPVADLGPDKTACAANQVVLKGAQAEKYRWSTGATAREITVNSSGKYWVEAINGDCIATDTIRVTFFTEKDFWLGEDISLCEGDVAVLKNNIIQADFTWNDGSRNRQLQVNKPGTYWLHTKVEGCEFTDTIQVDVRKAPVADLGPDQRICEGEQIAINAKNDLASHLWSTGETSKVIHINKTGKYWVKVTFNQCVATDTIFVEVIPNEYFMLGNDTVLCEGQALVLKNNVPGAIYQWSTGSQQPSITVNNAGKYWLHTIAGHCIKADTIEVKYVPLPVLYLGTDTMLCEGEERVLDAGNPGAYILWSTGETGQFIKIKKAGKYWANVRAGNCHITDTINLQPCPPVIYIPDAFTPDNNGVNDTFKIFTADVSEAELKIFNRWGECVFETNDVRTGWDGRFRNQLCAAERYIWIFRYRPAITPKADFKELSGTLMLIR
mgnify:CR=1 FL=1